MPEPEPEPEPGAYLWGAAAPAAAHSRRRGTMTFRLLRTSVARPLTAGFSAEDLKRAEAQWREQGSPEGLTSY